MRARSDGPLASAPAPIALVPYSQIKRKRAMASFVGKPLPDFQVKPLAKGALGAKTSLKGIAAGRLLVLHFYNGG